MPVRISLRHDLGKAAKDFDDVAKRQVPFALALALTRTAQEVRDQLRSTLGAHFTVRSKWVERSLQIDRAEKRDADPTARVGSLYLPMGLHAVGGTKKSRQGDVAIPVGARPTDEAVTKPNLFPSKLTARPNFFIAPFSRTPFKVGAGTETGVFERQAMGAGMQGPVAMRSRKRHSKAAQSPRHLKLWWTLEDDVRIRAEWPFEKTGIGVVDASLTDNFIAAMEQAMSTKR